MPDNIEISYDKVRVTGTFTASPTLSSSILDRIKSRAIELGMEATVEQSAISVSWPDALTLIREFGTRAIQTSLAFKFAPQGEAIERIKEFSEGFRKARASQGALKKEISQDEIQRRLVEAGFTKRGLKEFQLRDLENLLA